MFLGNLVQLDREQIILRDLLTLSASVSVKEAIAVLLNPPLEEQKKQCIWAIGDNQQLLGYLTERDALRLAFHQSPLDTLPLMAVVNKPLITLQESEITDVFTVLTLLQTYDLDYLPIVGDRGELRGMITTHSLLKTLRPPDGDQLATMLGCNFEAERLKHEQIEEELRQSRAIKQAILSAIPNLMYRVSADGIYLECFSTQYVADVLPADINPVGKHLSEVLPPELAQRKLKLIDQVLKTGEIQRFEQHLPIGDKIQYEEVQIVKMNAQETLTIIQNISDRKQAENSLRESEERFRSIFDTAAIGMAIASLEGKHVLVNPAFCKMLGYSEAELTALSFQEITYPADLDIDLEHYHQLLTGKINYFHLEKRYIHKEGHVIWTEVSISLVRDQNQNPLYDIALIQNISDRKKAEQQIIHNALHDPLTDLPNRTLLMERIELAIKRCKRLPSQHYALLFLDLDRFKIINDSLGHLVGDQLLKSIAQKLKIHLREVDLVARLGGDEFVILLEDITDFEQVVPITERILKDCQTPFLLDGYEMSVSTSIGVVLGTPNYVQASELLRDADIAMYKAKSQGGNSYRVFDVQMHTQALSRLTLETELRQALKHQEFTVYYQPIMDLLNDRLVGFEALIRWHHPERGLVSPAVFMAIAEETGLIVPMDQWILRTACEQLVQWKACNFVTSPLKISVNLSAQDLRRSNLLQDIDQILAETQLDGSAIALEITESMLIENIDQTIELLRQLKERNIQISIDDFGTGYSSLNYLHRLPADNLKIDRNFVRQMQQDNRNYQVVNTIITLSNQLGLTVVAEGIETLQQLQWLQQLGCEFGQGYYFSKPLPVEEIEAMFFKSIYPVMR
ncbi:MAG: EAL domain-containing protein [Snowella sp.]|nr:EAL domain-containing protein [Snowella sp.]